MEKFARKSYLYQAKRGKVISTGNFKNDIFEDQKLVI